MVGEWQNVDPELTFTARPDLKQATVVTPFYIASSNYEEVLGSNSALLNQADRMVPVAFQTPHSRTTDNK